MRIYLFWLFSDSIFIFRKGRKQMGKRLYIAEKPSVAREFANALHLNAKQKDGYMESEDAIVTWCVGHLITMSYPESYDISLKKWSMHTLPFLPVQWKYEVIDSVKKQFNIVKTQLNRIDVDTIYICTDSGREGEYIYRLLDEMAGVKGKTRLRVWIDSQTEEEIKKGVANAKDWSEYDNISASAYLRAKEDYLMGINFSRILTLKFGPTISKFMNTKWTVLSVGRVMTCVLGMVVRREREIREFIKTPFYRVIGSFQLGDTTFDGEWKAVEGTHYYQSPFLYKENGFKTKEKANELIRNLGTPYPLIATVHDVSKKKENKYAPLLFNLAELQNECSKRFKISPDETLKITQELYEKKLVTYPRTDARVLSTAVAKEIYKNISGLKQFTPVKEFAEEILATGTYKSIGNSRYTNDKLITDHYAIIPTGQGFQNMRELSMLSYNVYELIVRRFLSIFYPPVVYQKYSLDLLQSQEHFFANFRVQMQEGYLKVATPSCAKENKENSKRVDNDENNIDIGYESNFISLLNEIKKDSSLSLISTSIKEGETAPPKRYNSGSLILAMENAGQLIEDEELRSQIKGSGIGTSATRAEILKKLCNITYLSLNKKTQIITPTLLGELVFDVVNCSMQQLLNPDLTASWEKGLSYVAEGSITTEEYMTKLETFICNRTNAIKSITNPGLIQQQFVHTISAYQQRPKK